MLILNSALSNVTEHKVMCYNGYFHRLLSHYFACGIDQIAVMLMVGASSRTVENTMMTVRRF